MSADKSNYLRQLRQLIDAYFNLADIETLCVDLGIEYEHLPGAERQGIIKSLIQYLARRRELDRLLGLLREERPNVDWPYVPPNVDFTAEFDVVAREGAQEQWLPSLPSHYLSRETDLANLREMLLTDSNEPVGITGKRLVGVYGMGGIGKSVMAAAIARDALIKEAFSNGVYWLTMGERTTETYLVNRQVTLARTLGEKQAAFADIQQGKAELGRLLADKSCLLILDDVWQVEQVRAFDIIADNRNCRLLITTRNADLLLPLNASELQVDILDEQQSLQLLAAWAKAHSVDELPLEARDIAKECKFLPLALALCGAQVRSGTAWQQLLNSLQEANLAFLDTYQVGERGIMASMKVSIEALPPIQAELYELLAAIDDDTPIPEAALMTVWSYMIERLNSEESLITSLEHLVTLLKQRSLLRVEGEPGQRQITLHDMQGDYLRQQAANISMLHRRWLEAYGEKCGHVDGLTQWAHGPNDGYFFQQLTYHMRQAGRTEELRRLLLDYTWLHTKLNMLNVDGLLADYDRIVDTIDSDDPLHLLRASIQMSAPVLMQDSTQLAAQLTGRLRYETIPKIRKLLDEIKEQQQGSWLEPLRSNLTPPTSPLASVLRGHKFWIDAIALSSDGKKAVSISLGDAKVWDLEKYVPLNAISNVVAGPVLGLSPDSQHIVARKVINGRSSNTLAVVDLNTGQIVYTFADYGSSTNSLTALTMTPDGKFAVSGSEGIQTNDYCLRIWEIATGLESDRLYGHTRSVRDLDVSPDGRYIISASNDNTLKIWDMEQRKEVHTLRGHTDGVRKVIVSPNGRYVFSGSNDTTVKMWGLVSGEEIQTFLGHKNWITALAVSPDSQFLVAAAGYLVRSEFAVIVWHIDGTQVARFYPHTDQTTALEFTPDGKQLVSASRDQTLKIWDFQRIIRQGNQPVQLNNVRSVVITPDGKHAISGEENAKVELIPERGSVLAASGHHLLRLHVVSDASELCNRVGDGWISYLFAPSDNRSVKLIAEDPFTEKRVLMGWNIEKRDCIDELMPITSNFDWNHVRPISHGGQFGITSVNREYKSFRIFDLERDTELCTINLLQAKEFPSVAIFPQKKFVAFEQSKNTIVLHDFANATISTSISVYGQSISSIRATPNEKNLIVADHSGRLSVWDVDEGTFCYAVNAHDNFVTVITMSQDSRILITGSWDHSIRAWEISTGKLIARFDGESGIECCAITPDGQTIVAGDAYGYIHFLRLRMGLRNS